MNAIDEWRMEGKKQRDTEIVTNMLKKGLTISLISECTGLSSAKIEKLKKKIKEEEEL